MKNTVQRSTAGIDIKLGLLLSNAFINDLFHFVKKCKLYNYADDNSMSYGAPAIENVCSALVFIIVVIHCPNATIPLIWVYSDIAFLFKVLGTIIFHRRSLYSFLFERK